RTEGAARAPLDASHHNRDTSLWPSVSAVIHCPSCMVDQEPARSAARRLIPRERYDQSDDGIANLRWDVTDLRERACAVRRGSVARLMVITRACSLCIIR